MVNYNILGQCLIMLEGSITGDEEEDEEGAVPVAAVAPADDAEAGDAAINKKDEEAVETLCQLFFTAGKLIESNGPQQLKDMMENLFGLLNNISMDKDQYSSRIRFLIMVLNAFSFSNKLGSRRRS
jgi:hypothetical protein